MQARANAEAESAKIFSVASEENLGADPPTGSKSVIFNILSKASPECWAGAGLSWTCHGYRLLAAAKNLLNGN